MSAFEKSLKLERSMTEYISEHSAVTKPALAVSLGTV